MVKVHLVLAVYIWRYADGFQLVRHRCSYGYRHAKFESYRYEDSTRSMSHRPDTAEIDQIYLPKIVDPRKFERVEQCKTTSQAQSVLKEVLSGTSYDNSKHLYDSIKIPSGTSLRGLSDGELAIQTRSANRKYKITELIDLNGNRDIERASLGLFFVTFASIFFSLTINQNLPGPDIFRFVIVWLITFTPFVFIGYGIKDPDKIQSILVDTLRKLSPSYKNRMVQHEAGHFLMGYLLGWPVATYQTNAVKNAVQFYSLSDLDRGKTLARQLGFDKPRGMKETVDEDIQSLGYYDIPFFSDEGRGALLLDDVSVSRKQENYTSSALKLQPSNEPRNAWPFRGFDDGTLDQLTVISVAGACSEILAFGNAEGGVADFFQLKQIFNSAERGIDDREQDNRIRYAIGYTISQLRLNLGVLDDLAVVMGRGGSIAECVAAIESSTNKGGENENERRQKIRQEASFVEKILFFGGDRHIDTLEDRLELGQGGGGRKVDIRLPGDDPLYAALAVTIMFLLWSCNGGLSLH